MDVNSLVSNEVSNLISNFSDIEISSNSTKKRKLTSTVDDVSSKTYSIIFYKTM